jgi:hypothetical protein
MRVVFTIWFVMVKQNMLIFTDHRILFIAKHGECGGINKGAIAIHIHTINTFA